MPQTEWQSIQSIAMRINSAAEFEALMNEIDEHLQRNDAPMYGRELRVMQEVARRLSQSFPLSGPFGFKPIEGLYIGPSLVGHVNAWLQRRYGDRLKVDMCFGYTAILLRSDAWLMRIPLVLGSFQVIAERDLSKTYPTAVVYKPGSTQKLTVSVLPTIRDLPQGLANALTDAELGIVLSNFLESFHAFRFLDAKRKANGLAMAAAEDLTQSAKKAAGSPDEYGMSRWDALQGAEKALKLLLESKNVAFPKGRNGHDLKVLMGLALPVGMPPEAAELVDHVQCDAAVRYERRSHRRDDAIRAHRAAISIVRAVARTLSYPA